ncbi:MAG: lipoate--protein ligase [Clostridiaceae bacterium]
MFRALKDSKKEGFNMKLRLAKSNSFNPWFNLSLEEKLTNNVQPDEIILYLWQNENTVVIGKNQNAWKECAWQQLQDDNGKLARRLSGGGAVYHDLGNLNFTFIMNKAYYDLQKQHSVITSALKKFDINAEFSGRNDMLIGGKKFSGHAYYFNKNKAYHHGTLMVSSDLEKLGYYLKPSDKKIKSKGIESVRARVTNITDVNPKVTIEELKQSMDESFVKSYCGTVTDEVYEESLNLKNGLYEKYSSWEWRFGESPVFDITFTEKFPWAEVEFGFSLKNGEIISSRIFTDAMDTELFSGLVEQLNGCKFQEDEIQAKIDATMSNVEIKKDVINWIADLGI